MGAGIGAFAALFWGMWAGIVVTVRKLEEAEGRGSPSRRAAG
jgi:hypothetical protein